MPKKLESVEEITRYLKAQVIHYRKKVEKGYTMDDNLTKWGGYRIGYDRAKLSAYENLLDYISGTCDWENDPKFQETKSDSAGT